MCFIMLSLMNLIMGDGKRRAFIARRSYPISGMPPSLCSGICCGCFGNQKLHHFSALKELCLMISLALLLQVC
jgi:hypothetical protein